MLDCQLNWNIHIDRITSKLTCLIGSLRNIVHCLPLQIRRTIYNSLVKPHLLYLIEIWGSAPKTTLKNLQTRQNRVIKRLFLYDYLTPTEQIYSETKIMSINQLYTYYTCILIRKILDKSIHTQITFTKVHHIRRSSRRKDHLVLPTVRTVHGKRSISFAGKKCGHT